MIYEIQSFKSGILRLPRLGKIRLGVKQQKGGREYPLETSHFICPPEVEQVYGPRPTTLEVLLPSEDLRVVFPHAYEWYGGPVLKCRGDGETALRRRTEVEPGTPVSSTDLWVPIACPCPRLQTGECRPRGHLLVVLPRVNLGGVYEVATGSVVAIRGILGTLHYLRNLLGRVSWVPLLLRRAPQNSVYNGKVVTHHILTLVFEGTWQDVDAIRKAGPGPVVELPQAHHPTPAAPRALPTGDSTAAVPPAEDAAPEPPKPSPLLQALREAGVLGEGNQPRPELKPGLEAWLRVACRLPSYEGALKASQALQEEVAWRIRGFRNFRDILAHLATTTGHERPAAERT